MDRRDLLKSTGAAAAASTLAVGSAIVGDVLRPSAPAINTGIKHLRLALPWAEGFAGPANWANRLAQSIATLGQGRLRVSFQFSSADGMMALSRGETDLFYGDLSEHPLLHRSCAYFSGLPGDRGMSAHQLNMWVTAGGGQALWDELSATANIKPLLAGHTGSVSFLVAGRPAESMAALGGNRVQVSGLGGEVARGLGLETVTLAPDRIATAIEHGDLLAAECGGAIVTYALGLQRVAHYSAGTSINRNGTALALAVNRTVWEGLNDTERAVLNAAAANEFSLSLAEEEAHRHLLHPPVSASHLWPIAQELAHAIGQISDAVVAHVAGTDALSRRLNANYVAFQRAARGESFIA